MTPETGLPVLENLLRQQQITADDLIAALYQALADGAQLSAASEGAIEDIFFRQVGGDDDR